ncbi:hypothetical protein A2U01_0088291, partial [Trifolium medium]|nr:hypothetical protein [Trifolium medium]
YNVAQDAVTSATAEASKKDDSREIPTSKENTITESQQLEEDPKTLSDGNNQDLEPEIQEEDGSEDEEDDTMVNREHQNDVPTN